MIKDQAGRKRSAGMASKVTIQPISINKTRNISNLSSSLVGDFSMIIFQVVPITQSKRLYKNVSLVFAFMIVPSISVPMTCLPPLYGQNIVLVPRWHSILPITCP